MVFLPLADVEDHLHIRGEHLVLCDFLELSAGSPPHTWRTQ